MRFFEEMTTLNILGIVLLALGAALTFTSKKIAAKLDKPHREIAFMFIGLAVVIAGFLLIILV